MSKDILIGNKDGQFISLNLQTGSPPENEDYHWVGADIHCALGGFSGQFRAMVTLEELQRFYDDAIRLKNDLTHTARFETMEDQLRIIMKGNSKGHINISGHLRDVAGTGNKLDYTLELDQTYLGGISKDLKNALEAKT